MIIKKVSKFIWNEFIYGGHLLSLGASAIMYLTTVLLGQKINIALLAIGYLLSQIVYSYDHLKTAEKDYLTNPDRVGHILKFKNFLLGCFATYLAILIGMLIYLKSWHTTLVVIFIITFGILYSIVMKKFTKKIIIFKNIYTAFLWAFVIILVNAYYQLPLNNSTLLLLFLFVFLKSLFSTIFFDIKDIKSDKEEKLKTLPIILGKERTLKSLHLLNLISFFPLIFGIQQNLFPSFILWLLIFYLYRIYYLEQSNKENTNIHFLSFVLADGEYFFWAIIIFLVKL